MPGWALVVDLVRASIFALAHAMGGSVGGAIVVVSVAIRLALLPLSIRTARLARAHADKLRALQPELERLRKRLAGDPAALSEATLALYRRHEIGLLPRGSVSSLLVQGPIGAAVYQAIGSGVRRAGAFFWIGDLARPDLLIAAVAALLAGLSVSASGTGESAQRGVAFTSALITFVLAWRLSAGVGLYWAASNLVGVGQAMLLNSGTGHRKQDSAVTGS